MRALVWTAPEVMEIQEQPEPTPAADEVVIRVAYAGICGSELSGFSGPQCTANAAAGNGA